MTNKPRIYFRNFPHDFDKKDNFFLKLTEDALKNCNYKGDIYFYGSYPDSSLVKKILLFINSKISNNGMNTWLKFQQGTVKPVDDKAFNVWCTFENRRPPVNGFDCTFSFDIDDLNGSNCYLPLIFLYLKINSAKSKHAESATKLTKPRIIEPEILESKKGFLASFINNPHPIRMHAIKRLNEIGKVNLFGRSVNNYVNDKIEEASKFWFNLCFENDLYPGYVTEKALEAYLAKTVPLYWGQDTLGIINPRAVINLNDFKNINDFADYVKVLYSDEKRMVAILEEPLFIKEFDYLDVVDFLTKKLMLRE